MPYFLIQLGILPEFSKDIGKAIFLSHYIVVLTFDFIFRFFLSRSGAILEFFFRFQVNYHREFNFGFWSGDFTKIMF